MRSIHGDIVDRAKFRFTLTYAITPRLSAGVELNPIDEDIGPILNWRVWDETQRRPALIVGTSSDRIGSTRGRAVYATLSKDLEGWTDLPIAPYVGITYGDFEEEWREIAGLYVRWSDDWSSTTLWDGVNLHQTVDHQLDTRNSIGALLVEQDGDHFLGLRFGSSF